MSLTRLKQRLSVDQRNILIATVLEDKQSTVRVRTARGEIRDAAKSPDQTYNPGQRLEVRTDGRTVTVIGPAALAELSGELIVTV